MSKQNQPLKQNAFYVPHLDKYYISTHVHDFVQYTHTDGRIYFIDGGTCYFRAGGNFDLIKEGVVIPWCIDENTPIDQINIRLLWGSRGLYGKDAISFRPISSLVRSHLRGIKRNCASYAHPTAMKVVRHWLDAHYNE